MVHRIVLLMMPLSFSVSILSPSGGGELPVTDPADAGFSADQLAATKTAMQNLVDEGDVPGVITVVARKGQIVFFETSGYRDIEAKRPMERETILRIYSMTKPITSVAVMMLVEEGKLALDDPVKTHLPELGDPDVFVSVEDGKIETEPSPRAMTVRDLLRHTSGLTYGFFGETPVDLKYRAANVLARSSSLAEMSTKLGKLPLLVAPGTRFTYSVSTDVLGRLVEVVAEQPLDVFFAERILGPLDMHDTGFHVPTEKLDRFATNYGPRPTGGFRTVDVPAESSYRKPPGLLSGGGGLVSTARDYIRFCQMLVNRGELHGTRLLRAETVDQMTRNQLPDAAYPITLNGRRPGVGFGLGFSVIVEKTEYTAATRVGEYGWGGAASTHFWISPSDDLAVVVLTQQMPYTPIAESTLKPIVYGALEKQ